jgi:hypothetical protein
VSVLVVIRIIPPLFLFWVASADATLPVGETGVASVQPRKVACDFFGGGRARSRAWRSQNPEGAGLDARDGRALSKLAASAATNRTPRRFFGGSPAERHA